MTHTAPTTPLAPITAHHAAASPLAPQPPPVAAAPTDGGGGDTDDAKRKAAGQQQHHFQMPEVAQYGISSTIDHFYGIYVGPWIRNHVETALGHKPDDPYKPKNTAGFLTREIAYGAAVNYIDIGVTKALLAMDGTHVGNLLTSAGGAIGATASLTGLKMLRNTAATVGVGVLFDALWGAKIGDWIEGGVNKLTGHKDDSGTNSKITSNTALSTVKQTHEQTARAFGRSMLATTSYTLLYGAVGQQLSKAIFRSVGGPVGAILGAFGGQFICTMGNHVVMWAMGTQAANIAQGAMRAVEGVFHLKKDAKTAPDVVPKIGDRVSISVEGTVVPALTALLSGKWGSYTHSLAD